MTPPAAELQMSYFDSAAKVPAWLDRWRDLGTFEVVPVITSAEAAERVSAGIRILIVVWRGSSV